jgi:hypothetical protein
MDDATSTVLMREMAENRQNRQLAQLYQGLARLLHEALALPDQTGCPMEPLLKMAPEPAALGRYAGRLDAWLEVKRAEATEKAAQRQYGPSGASSPPPTLTDAVRNGTPSDLHADAPPAGRVAAVHPAADTGDGGASPEGS